MWRLPWCRITPLSTWIEFCEDSSRAEHLGAIEKMWVQLPPLALIGISGRMAESGQSARLLSGSPQGRVGSNPAPSA